MRLQWRRQSEDRTQECVASAHARLAEVHRAGESAIAELARQFQALAGDCEQLMAITRELVTATQSSSAQDALPFMRRIYSDCEGVLQLRLEASGGVAELLQREQELLEELERPSRAQQSTARTAKILAVMLRIEIARLGSDGNGFTYMSSELEQASETISQSVNVLHDLIHARQDSTPARRSRIDGSRSQARRNLALIERDRDDALKRADRALSDFKHLPVAFDACVQDVSANIGRVTAAVQMQDLTRQQTEHISAVLQAVMGMPGAASLCAAHIPTVLCIQHEQLANVQRTTEGWLLEVEQCVASILRLGDVELLAIMAQILSLEKSLEDQGRWVAQFESEFDQHDHVNVQELAEFETMMQMVREHLEQSQKTSEHLQLLNLNSMVAAHNVGTQAASVLQITNSISRLATDWRGLTRESVGSMEHMLVSATSRGDETRIASDSTRAAISVIEEESRTTLESLRRISELGAGCQRRGQDAVRQMHSRVQQVHRSVEALRGVVAGISAACSDISLASQQSGRPDPLQLPEMQRHAIEQELCNTYTSEIERQILRSVLFGETMPSPDLKPHEGAIELF